MDEDTLRKKIASLSKVMSSEAATKSTFNRRNGYETEYRRLCLLGVKLGYWPAQKLRARYRGK